MSMICPKSLLLLPLWSLHASALRKSGALRRFPDDDEGNQSRSADDCSRDHTYLVRDVLWLGAPTRR